MHLFKGEDAEFLSLDDKLELDSLAIRQIRA
jgi:hypothetical protein